MEVEGDHAYRVGEQGILVHNPSVAIPCPPTNCVDCEPEATFTAGILKLINKKKQPGNFITAEMTKLGYFKFTVENEPKDKRGCHGWWLFEVAWDFWVNNQKASIKGIRGDWTYGDNLKTINDLTAGGKMTLEEAAKHTWTYQQAKAKGFTTYQQIDPPVGSPGHYTDVQVVFLP